MAEPEFVLMVNGKIETYHNYEDIPDEFDHVIKFAPGLPTLDDPVAQHEASHLWHERLLDLVQKEVARASSNKSRG